MEEKKSEIALKQARDLLDTVEELQKENDELCLETTQNKAEIARLKEELDKHKTSVKAVSDRIGYTWLPTSGNEKPMENEIVLVHTGEVFYCKSFTKDIGFLKTELYWLAVPPLNQE